MQRIFIALLLFVNVASIRAQDPELDSLLAVLKTAPPDTNKLKLLDAIIDIAPDGEWEKYNLELGVLAKKMMSQSSDRTLWLSKRYYAVSIANRAYEAFNAGDNNKALSLYDSCIQINRAIGEKAFLAGNLASIGAAYSRQGEYGQALKNLKEAEAILASENNVPDYVVTLTNIGVLYKEQGMLDTAMKYLQKGLDMANKTNFENYSVCVLLAHMGEIALRQDNIDQAFSYANKGLSISQRIGSDRGKTQNNGVLARIFLRRKELSQAMAHSEQAVEFARKTGDPKDIYLAYQISKDVLIAKGNFQEALGMFALEMEYKDSVESQENQKLIIRHQYKYEYDLKEATTKAEQEKKDGIAQAELKRQKVQKLAFLGGFGVMLLFAGVFFRQRNKIGREKKRSEDLLLNILPEEVAEELKIKGEAETKYIDNVTVLFTDFKGFTAMSEHLTPKELVRDIHESFSAFDHIMDKYGMEKIKTIGDAYMAAGGLPTANLTHATDAVNAALEIRKFIEEGKARKIATGQPYFEIRIGIHTGPVVAGIVGVKKFAYDIWGDTVNTASRMESSGEVGQINISGSTYELVKDKFTCIHRGKVQAKNKGEIDMYFVERAKG